MLNGHAVTDLIAQRQSVRSYTETPIAPEIQSRLRAFMADHATGPLGTPVRMALIAAQTADAERLRGLGTYGFIRGAMGYLVGALPAGAEHDHGLEDFGYVMERVVLLATALGLGTVWLGGTFTKSHFARAVRLRRDETLPAVVATGYPARQPRGLDRWIRRGAKSDRRRPWRELFFATDEGVPPETLGRPLTKDAAGPYAPALTAVRRGPSASNKQPWRLVRETPAGGPVRWHFYLQRTRGYGPRNALIGIADMQRIDLGIAMGHFDLTTRELGLPGRWELAPPDRPRPDGPATYTATWVAA